MFHVKQGRRPPAFAPQAGCGDVRTAGVDSPTTTKKKRPLPIKVGAASSWSREAVRLLLKAGVDEINNPVEVFNRGKFYGHLALAGTQVNLDVSIEVVTQGISEVI